MTDEEFMEQLREAFAIEAGEHLQAMAHGLLELEQKPEADRKKKLVEAIFRDAHSMKGAARAVDRSDIEAVCQELEGIFSAWKKEPQTVAAATFDVLNRAVDLVSNLLPLPKADPRAKERGEVASLVAELHALAQSAAPVPVAEPAPAPPHSQVTAPAPAPVETLPAVVHTPAETGVEHDLTGTAGTIRISLAKMDSLLRQVRELIGVKLATSRRAEEVRALDAGLEAWRREWSKVSGYRRGGLAQQRPAALARVEEFLDWNEGFLRSLEEHLGELRRATARDERHVGAMVDELVDDTTRLIMLPFGSLLDLFPRMVRDLARSAGKEVRLELRGREVQIDKQILQEIKDPLIHLVRNGVDHGVEKPAARQAAGKPVCGVVSIAVAQLDGNRVEIIVRDDGAGIDPEKVKSSAIRCGTVTEDEARGMDEAAALGHIFDSGVSTSDFITEISGRGLGMAIVREKVEKLGGSIVTESRRGQGVAFRILLPVTLATFNGVLVAAGGQTFVIPTAHVESIKRVKKADVRRAGNVRTIQIADRAVSLVDLEQVLGLPARPATGQDDCLEAVILGAGDLRIAFVVEAVHGEQKVLMKSLGKPLLRVRNVTGATLLGAGRPVVILNPAGLLKSAVNVAAQAEKTPAPALEMPAPRRRASILVADDSVTSRLLIRNILESAGYTVTTAMDGVDAITTLRSREFDLVVSDVEMPRLDGYGLTAKIRADRQLAQLPVILVTALSSRESQERGMEAGANAYIVKTSFDQSNLLEAVHRLL